MKARGFWRSVVDFWRSPEAEGLLPDASHASSFKPAPGVDRVFGQVSAMHAQGVEVTAPVLLQQCYARGQSGAALQNDLDAAVDAGALTVTNSTSGIGRPIVIYSPDPNYTPTEETES